VDRGRRANGWLEVLCFALIFIFIATLGPTAKAQRCLQPSRLDVFGCLEGVVYYNGDHNIRLENVSIYLKDPHTGTYITWVDAHSSNPNGEFSVEQIPPSRNYFVIGDGYITGAEGLNRKFGTHFTENEHVFGQTPLPVFVTTGINSIDPNPNPPNLAVRSVEKTTPARSKLGTDIDPRAEAQRHVEWPLHVELMLVSARTARDQLPSPLSGSSPEFYVQLSVTLTDATNSAPIPNAELSQRPATGKLGSQPNFVSSGASGKLALGLASGEYDVEAVAKGFIPSLFVLSVSPREVIVNDALGARPQKIAVKPHQTTSIFLSLRRAGTAVEGPGEETSIAKLYART
jgi:hypothetical protein